MRLASWYTRLMHSMAQRLDHGRQHPLGPRGEELAYWYLRERGFTMVARNYRRAGIGGEVDLVGWDGGTLVFIEVKTRTSIEVRKGEDAVNHDKRRHLIAAARDYVRRAHVESPYRFDVIGISFDGAGKPMIEHLRDAFSESAVLG